MYILLKEASFVLSDLQEPLKASVLSSMRSMLHSFTDVCDAVYPVEIGLRFLGKTGGNPQDRLLSYLTDSLKMDQQISSTIAEVRHASCNLKEIKPSRYLATSISVYNL